MPRAPSGVPGLSAQGLSKSPRVGGVCFHGWGNTGEVVIKQVSLSLSVLLVLEKMTTYY